MTTPPPPAPPPITISRRAQRLDPTLDPTFKYLFQDEELLKELLNRVLHLPDGERLTALTYQEGARPPEGEERRGVIFDLLVTDQRGRRYEVEIQRHDKGAQLLRAQYYGARLLGAQLNEAEDFALLTPVRVVMFTRFELFPDPHPARTYHLTPYLITEERAHLPLHARAPHLAPFDLSATTHYLQTQRRARLLRDAEEARELMTFTFVELCKDLAPLSAPCQRALRALSPAPSKEDTMNATAPNPHDRVPLPPHLANDPWVVSFYQRLDRFAGDPARVADYERTLLELSDRVTELNKAHREGREEGISVGREEGISVGREEGISVGREEGISVGREEVLSTAISALLSAGKTPHEVSALLALTPHQRARLLPSG